MGRGIAILYVGLLLILIVGTSAYADDCDQACSDAESAAQQAASDAESAAQQAASDAESAAQQAASDAGSAAQQAGSDAESASQQSESDAASIKRQKESDAESAAQQAASDLESFVQQVESDLKSKIRETRGRNARLDVVSEVENGEMVQKVKFRGTGVESQFELESVEDGAARVRLSDGNYQDIDVMPSTAFRIAMQRLKSQDLDIQLQESGDIAAVYVAKADKTVKLLGLFDVQHDLEVTVNAENGDIEFETPWWWFLVQEVDEISDLDLQLIKPIQDIVLVKNEIKTINLDNYFLNAESYYFLDANNVKLDINEAMLTIFPDTNWVGTTSVKIVANREDDSLATTFNVIATEDNVTVQTVQYEAVLNEPVRWKKKVSLDGTERITLKLPKSSENIAAKSDVGPVNILSQRDTNDDIEIDIEDDNYEVEYYTEAPSSVEEDISEGKKRITIVGSEEVHYTDILAFQRLPMEVPADSVRLFHIKDGRTEVQLDKYDVNENGLVDYVEWIVPMLSNETYELEFDILNIQSYPTVGGNWTVVFNTTGTANLTISAINGTTYGGDLTPLELRCGNNARSFSWQGNIVDYTDWECGELGFWTVKVLTTGVHIQEFNFGGLIGHAYNFASENISFVPPTPLNNSAQNENWIFVNISSQENLNDSLLEWGNSSGYFNLSMSSTSAVNWYRNMTSLEEGSYDFTVWAQNGTVNVTVWIQSVRRFVTLDFTPPTVSIDYPLNTTYNINVSQLDYTSSGVYCWYSTDGGATNSSAISCLTDFTDVNSAEGSNTWTVYSNDSAGNINSSSVSFFKDTVNPEISFSGGTPADYASLSQDYVYVNVSFNEADLGNVTFYIYNEGGLVDSETYTTATYSVNWTGLDDGVYNYEVNMTDAASNENSTGRRFITLDTTLPVITFSCSKYSLALREALSCSCSAVDNIDQNPVVTYTVNPSTSKVGAFDTMCVAVDQTGNADSKTLEYKVSVRSEGYPDYSVSSEKLEEGYDRKLRKNWKMNFKVEEDTHTLLVKDVGKNSVQIVVSSDPQEATLTVGEEKLFELDGDNYYDVSVKLNSLEDSWADLTVKSVHIEIEVIPEVPETPPTPPVTQPPATEPVIETTPEETKYEWKWEDLIIVIVIILIFVFLAKSGWERHLWKQKAQKI